MLVEDFPVQMYAYVSLHVLRTVTKNLQLLFSISIGTSTLEQISAVYGESCFSGYTGVEGEIAQVHEIMLKFQLWENIKKDRERKFVKTAGRGGLR